MCFSEPVSWATWVINVAGVTRAYSTGNAQTKTLALILLYVGSMQAFEALLWRDPTNKALATTAMLVNHTQPLVFWGLSRKLPAKDVNKKKHADMLAAAYAAVATTYTLQVDDRTLVKETPCGLQWTWNYGKYAPVMYASYLASVLATLDAYYDDSKNLSALFLATFATSVAIYQDRNMIGSMWCFFAAFLPWLL
jgi:hypothetical protein